MTNWSLMTLREAGVTLIDCVHATPHPVENGYPYVAIPQMKNGHIDFAEARQISVGDFEEWTKKARPRRHDVVLSRRTNPGVTAVARDGRYFAVGQNLVLLRADGSTVLPQFLRWLTRGPAWWEQIEKFMNVGAVFNSLRCADVPRFQLSIPPMAVQAEISAALDDLDDKIELNRQMNETLEAMAQAIFRDWFVDFGPTRRKIEGASDPVEIMGGLVNNAKWAQQLADLFPARLGDSGLPEKWTTTRMDALAAQHTATIAPSSTPEEVFAHFSLPAFDAGCEPILEAGAGILSNKTRVPPNAVLLSKLNPEILRVWMTPLTSSHKAISSTEFLAFTAKGTASREYLYCLFKDAGMRSQLQGMVTGTSKSHQRVSPKALAGVSVTLPGAVLVNHFSYLVGSLLEATLVKKGENRTLAATRDLLLPRLMSGEIRLQEAGEVLEAAQ